MKLVTLRIAMAAAVLAAATSGLVLVSPAASAAPKTAAVPLSVQGNCSPIVGCSQIHNDSHTFIIIRPNWTCGGTTGSTGGIGCTSGTSTYLWAGQHTPTNQDWDTFRVDPGWCYKVKFYLPFKSWTVKYNRIGLGEIWVKVEDWATAVIQAQSVGSCPA